MKIEITQRKQTMEFNKKVMRSEITALVDRVMSGEVIMREDEQEISVADFVKSNDVEYYCQDELIELLCERMENVQFIRKTMRKLFTDKIEMMFSDYGVVIE